MSTTKRGTILAVTAIVAAVIATACVEKDPIVTGHRPPAKDAAAAPITVLPAADDPDDDLPDCRRCGETLSTDTARGTLCRKNVPSASVRLLNDLVDCVCYDKCIQQCASYCSGSIREDSCAPCIIAPENCLNVYTACLADVTP
jgi:hypothetical protein